MSVSPVPRTPAANRRCPALLAAVPRTLLDGTLDHRVAAQAQSQYVAAWGAPPVILHCGVSRPKGFVVGAGTTVIDGVTWFESGLTWTAVDREVYVSVYAPELYGGAGPLVEVGPAIRKTLPRQAIQPGG